MLQFDNDPSFLDSLLDEEGMGLDAPAFAGGAAFSGGGGAAAADDGSLSWEELMTGLDDLPQM